MDIKMVRERLAAARAGLIAALSVIEDAELARPWPWRGGGADVRYGLLRIADHEQEQTVQIAQQLASLGWRQTEAQRILGLAEISRGWLLGELAGLRDDLLDREPAPGEWPLRTVLAHIIVTERRYRQRTAWHVAEARAGRATTAEPPAGVVEPLQAAAQYAGGSLEEILARLDLERSAVLAELAGLVAADLEAPTSWVGFAVDVRFRLHRFAAHEREHTVQVAKTLRGAGFVPSEAQRILAQAQVTRGHLLARLVGLPDELAARPAAGAGSVAEMLAHIGEAEVDQVASIRQALGG